MVGMDKEEFTDQLREHGVSLCGVSRRVI
ncbi:MAG: hypothetical protein K9I68_08385 [Bacteroidales bacterium]|nr:hypothetical protein [Bacteroidales bacterium]MCF8337691.1 hypothetical protein [Bacteroidales bacterium]